MAGTIFANNRCYKIEPPTQSNIIKLIVNHWPIDSALPIPIYNWYEEKRDNGHQLDDFILGWDYKLLKKKWMQYYPIFVKAGFLERV